MRMLKGSFRHSKWVGGSGGRRVRRARWQVSIRSVAGRLWAWGAAGCGLSQTRGKRDGDCWRSLAVCVGRAGRSGRGMYIFSAG